MSMHRDLVTQATELVGLDPKRPKQANLRRAVSAAYYALFHYLIDQSCRSVMGARHEQARYRHVLGRAFTHKTMKAACTEFVKGVLKPSVQQALPAAFEIPREARLIAGLFVELQERRHAADYDLTVRFGRNDARATVVETDRAIDAFQSLASSPAKTFFLACLWAWTSLGSR